MTRAQAGGALPGVPSAASQSTSVASGQGVQGSQAAAGVQGGGGCGAPRGTGNASISQIGPVTQNLDPTIQETTTFSHITTPQPNSVQSLTSALVQNQRAYSGSIQQGLLSGGSLAISYSNHYLNENSPTDVLNPSLAPSLSITLQHNLLNGFGTEVGGRTITISKINLATSDLTFRSQVIAVVNNVLNGYYTLVAADEDVKAKQSAFDVAQTFLGDTAKQIDLGSLAETERIKAESQLATTRQDLIVSQTTLSQDEVRLKNLISRKGIADPLLAAARIVALDRLAMPAKDDLPPVKELVAKALANRPDLAAEKANLAGFGDLRQGYEKRRAAGPRCIRRSERRGSGRHARTEPQGAGTADAYFVGGASERPSARYSAGISLRRTSARSPGDDPQQPGASRLRHRSTAIAPDATEPAEGSQSDASGRDERHRGSGTGASPLRCCRSEPRTLRSNFSIQSGRNSPSAHRLRST